MSTGTKTGTKTEIFKYQASQFPRHESVLVYNKDRTVMGSFTMNKELETLFGTYGEKFYALGYRNEEGKVVIREIVDAPDW